MESICLVFGIMSRAESSLWIFIILQLVRYCDLPCSSEPVYFLWVELFVIFAWWAELNRAEPRRDGSTLKLLEPSQFGPFSSYFSCFLPTFIVPRNQTTNRADTSRAEPIWWVVLIFESRFLEVDAVLTIFMIMSFKQVK